MGFAKANVLECSRREGRSGAPLYSWPVRCEELISDYFPDLDYEVATIQVANSLGISADNAVQFPETPEGAVMAFQAISQTSVAYRTGNLDFTKRLKEAAKKKL